MLCSIDDAMRASSSRFSVAANAREHVHVQVTRSMFDKALPHVERAIEQCHFYAFDLEMTGLHVSDQRESWVDDMEDRYRVVGSCL